MPDELPEPAPRFLDRRTGLPIEPPAPPAEDVPEKPFVSTFDVINEALQKHAERRKDLGPPKEMPITPTLPKQPRPARDRKRRRKFDR